MSRFFAELTRALGDGRHRPIVFAGLIGITTGLLIMSAIVFDDSRSTSNWTVCRMLILHAQKAPPAAKRPAPLPTIDSTQCFGLAVTLIPRFGMMRPF